MWKARRHRKGRGIRGRFVRHPPRPFAWLDPRPFIHGGTLTAVRYCSALLLMMGASIFSFSNAVQLSPQVHTESLMRQFCTCRVNCNFSARNLAPCTACYELGIEEHGGLQFQELHICHPNIMQVGCRLIAWWLCRPPW